ncbi:MAG: DNA cytosine methyltransferase [Terriglobia bacterium]
MHTSIKQGKPRNRPTGVDLFCGVGGMSLGFEQAGFDVVAAVDFEPRHVETHSKNFPTCETVCADLSAISGAELRSKTGIGDSHIDVVFAGPPCQGFSLIGKRLKNDPRNLLLFDLARLIGELSPSYFAVENVEGILLGDAKNVLADFVGRLKKSGYCIVEPVQVLDAAEFGVPQLRRRVFVLGYKSGLSAPAYPKRLFTTNGNGDYHGPTVWDAIGDLPRIEKYKYLFTSDVYSGGLGAATQYARILRGDATDPQDKAHKRHTNGGGLSGCLRTAHTNDTTKRFMDTEPGCYEAVSRFQRLEKDELAHTLRAGTGPARGSFMAPRPIHPVEARCITVREAARLHSFPDWFSFHPTKWHAFRQIGNSVPPRLARAVAKCVRQALL